MLLVESFAPQFREDRVEVFDFSSKMSERGCDGAIGRGRGQWYLNVGRGGDSRGVGRGGP